MALFSYNDHFVTIMSYFDPPLEDIEELNIGNITLLTFFSDKENRDIILFPYKDSVTIYISNDEEPYMCVVKPISKGWKKVPRNCEKYFVTHRKLSQSKLLMNYYNFNAVDYLNSGGKIAPLVKFMIRAIYRISHQNLFYLDIKLDQIYIETYGSSNFYFGDIELYGKNSRKYRVTFPSPTLNHKKALTFKDVKWSLMCTILSCYTDVSILASKWAGGVYPQNISREWTDEEAFYLVEETSELIEHITNEEHYYFCENILENFRIFDM